MFLADKIIAPIIGWRNYKGTTKKGNLIVAFFVLLFEPGFDFGSCIKNIDCKSEPTCEEYYQGSNQFARSLDILFPNVENTPDCARKTD